MKQNHITTCQDSKSRKELNITRNLIFVHFALSNLTWYFLGFVFLKIKVRGVAILEYTK